MSDIVKWSLLTAAAVFLIGLVIGLPFFGFIDFEIFTNGITNIISYCSTGFKNARGLINNFLSPWARNVLSGLLLYLFAKYFITTAIRFSVWIYHFVFRG